MNDEICKDGKPHEWGIDGMHSNEFCKKCFMSRPPAKESQADVVVKTKIEGNAIELKHDFDGSELIEAICNRLNRDNIRVYDSAIINRLRELTFKVG